MRASGHRSLARLLALRKAAERKAVRALAQAAAEARAAAEGKTRVTRLIRGSSASAGAAHARDLAARATLLALLQPAFQQAGARKAALRKSLDEAMAAAAAARIARDAVAIRLEAARRARLARIDEQAMLDTPPPGRHRGRRYFP